MLVRKLNKHFGQAGLGEFFDFIGDAQIRLVDFDNPREVNGSRDQDQIAGSTVDGFFEFVSLDRAVAHRGQEICQVSIALVGATDRSHGIRPRIH